MRWQRSDGIQPFYSEYPCDQMRIAGVLAVSGCDMNPAFSGPLYHVTMVALWGVALLLVWRTLR